jgi:hypothetical protein
MASASDAATCSTANRGLTDPATRSAGDEGIKATDIIARRGPARTGGQDCRSIRQPLRQNLSIATELRATLETCRPASVAKNTNNTTRRTHGRPTHNFESDQTETSEAHASTCVHRIDIEPITPIGPSSLKGENRPQKYRVIYRGETLIESTKEPVYGSCRALVARGLTGSLAIWGGDPPMRAGLCETSRRAPN